MFQRFRRWRWFWPFAIALCLTLASSLWRINSASPKALAPALPLLPQDPTVQVFFNQSEASVYTDPYRHIERYGDDLEKIIITAIEQSTQSIDLAVQSLNLPRVAQAIVQSARRGIRIRIVLENEYANPTSAAAKAEQTAAWAAIADTDGNGTLTLAEIAQADALQILRSAQIPLIDDTADGSKGSGLMHHKFMVIDSRWVITGSANFTLSGIHGDGDEPASRGNANALLRIDSAALAQRFSLEFNQLWGDGPGASPNSLFGLKKPHRPAQDFTLPASSVTLQFSPLSPSQPWEASVNGLIARTLTQATRSIDLALFVFSDQLIANQLQPKAAAGKALRVLIDPSFLYRNYSEALDMLGVTLRDQRCQVEKDNQPWAKPIATVGFPQLPPGDKLHHKFAVIDEATVIIGSQNWSKAANNTNDETLLVIRNPTVAAHFEREFERLYRSPQIGNTPLLKRKIAENQQRCPSP